MKNHNKCLNCGAEIDGKRKYCSSKCKKKYLYANKIVLKTCAICGKEFKGTEGTKCCSPECVLKSQQIYKKICPVCGTTFIARGNGVYCSNSCYRLANNPTKGLFDTTCYVCGETFKTPKDNPKLTCSDECASNIMDVCIKNTLMKVFGTTDVNTIKAKRRGTHV